MVDYATEYAKAVVAGKKIACKAEIDACKRHLADLKRTDLEWHPEIAEKHVDFAEKLTVYDKNQKKFFDLKLRGFQKFIICSIFGWYKNGIRRFTEAYIQFARKNGKSFLVSFFCLDFATLAAIRDGQIYCTGTNYANAQIVWSGVKDFVKADKELAEFFDIKDYGDSRSKIVCKRNGTKIVPLSGDTEKDGFLPLLGCVDEYHLHPTDGMYNVLLDGQIGLNNSLLIAITTAGTNLNGPCYKQYKYAKQVAAGIIQADELFAYICELDLPDPHQNPDEYEAALWNPENWAKANPLLLYKNDYELTDDNNRWLKFKNRATKAREVEGEVLSDFLIKNLDVWTTIGSDAYLNIDDWAKCACDKTLQNYEGKRCFVGLDLSSKNDLASFAIAVEDDVPYLYSHSFLPKGTLARHIRSDKAPYDVWQRKGLLTLTDCAGKNQFILDYKFILNKMKEVVEQNKLKVVMVGYDPMGISGVLADLYELFPDAELVEVGQYPKSMNDATRNFKAQVQGGQVLYDRKNEMMTWSFVNAVAVLNSKSELLIDKQRYTNRIDVCDACLNAWKCLLTDAAKQTQAEKDAQAVDEWLSLMDNI